MIDDLDKTLEELFKRELSPAFADQVAITFAAPDDQGTEPFNPLNGNSFRLGATSVDWVLFKPDGIPVLGSGGGDCGTLSATGTAGGAIYITNGIRDYGIVLTPLGSVRVHSWDRNSNGWSS